MLEEKYTTQRHIQESLQGRIMELTAQLELQLHARPATTPPSTDSESHTSLSRGGDTPGRSGPSPPPTSTG